MSAFSRPKPRIADPFVEDNDRMLQRLIDEAFGSISHGKNHVNLMQAGTGLEFVFKRLQPVVPLPDRDWYSAVFRNFDVDRDGEIDRAAFEDIVLQYHAYHYEKILQRSKRHSQAQVSGRLQADTPSASEPSRLSHQTAGLPPPDQSVQLASYIMYPAHHGVCQVFKDYKVGKVVGKGSFGKVQLVTQRKTGAKRACKTIAIQSPEQWELIKSEVELLKALNHPNIMKLFETYQDGYTIYLIIERCKGGPLFDRIVQHYEVMRSPLTEEQGIVHRDLKPENILFVDVSEDSPLKIIDFGLSGTLNRLRETAREVKEKRFGFSTTLAKLFPKIHTKNIIPWYVRRVRMQRAGTPHYMAPEMIRGQYDEKCDLFAVGIIMFQLLSGYHPFFIPGVDNEHTAKTKILQDEPFIGGDAWLCVSPHAKDLLRRLIQKNPRKRISAQAALDHPWFTPSGSWLQRTFSDLEVVIMVLCVGIEPVHVACTALKEKSTFLLTPSVFEGLRSWQKQNRLKQAVLQLLAKELNETDIIQLRKKFEAFDRNGRGTITLDELKQSMRDAGYSVIESELEQMFNSIDANQQGHIGYNEFISTLLARRVVVREEQLREIFDKFDAKGEGRLTLGTLRDILKRSNYGALTDGELQIIFAEIDKNCDGYVDFYEFCDLMTAAD